MTNTKNGAQQRDVAVYLDFENLYVSLKTTAKMDPNFDILMEKCREFGRVILARAYADWSEFSRMYTSQMFANGLEPVFVPTRKVYDARSRSEARKNSVDIHITIDIVKSLFLHENVDVIILISGDRDYVPLINQIRQSGKAVYAIGVAGCTSSELSIAVDEMFFYHQLLDSGDTEKPAVDIFNQLLKALRIANRRGYPATLGILKPIMKELVEGFNERNYKNSRGMPFQKFKDLVQEAERRRLVKLVTSGATTEVYLWAEAPTSTTPAKREEAPARPAAARRDESEPPSGGRERTERGERGGRRRRGRGGERSEASQPPSEHETLDAAAIDGSGSSFESEADHDELLDLAPDDHEFVPSDAGDTEADETDPGDPHRSATEMSSTPRLPDRAGARPHGPRGSDRSSRGRQPRNRDRSLPEPSDPTHDSAGHGSLERAASGPDASTQEAMGREVTDDERLTGVAFTDTTWLVIREAVLSFAGKPPTPRRLMLELKKRRGAGAFGDVQPTDADLDDLIGQCVAAGRLKRERKGFSNILRLTELAEESGSGSPTSFM